MRAVPSMQLHKLCKNIPRCESVHPTVMSGKTRSACSADEKFSGHVLVFFCSADMSLVAVLSKTCFEQFFNLFLL